MSIHQLPPTVTFCDVVAKNARWGKPRDAPDRWKKDVLAWFERPGAPSKAAAAEEIGCDASSITNLLRLSTDRKPGPGTSSIANALANFTGIPLPSDAVDEFEEAAKNMRALKALNPAKLQRHLETLADAVAAEQFRSRNLTPATADNGGHGAGNQGGAKPRHRTRRR